MTEAYEPQHLLEQIKEFLIEAECRYTESPNSPTLCVMSSGRNAFFTSLIQVHPQRRVIICYSLFQQRAPEQKRAAVAEFVCRANYGLWIGNFEMDLRDGEVRYKSSLDLADGELTAEMFHALMWANLSTADRYLPGLMSVLWNDVAPEDAVSMVETTGT